jgi:putative ABC transport system permease protein
MFKHLFKLIWNKKKQNFLLISEMFISFLVIFAVFTFAVYAWQNYNKPMGFQYDSVWTINYNNAVKTNSPDSLVQFYETVRQKLESLPQIEDVSFTNDNTPFSEYTNGTDASVKGHKITGVNYFAVDDHYQKVLKMKIVEGRWYNKGDEPMKSHVVVINRLFAREAFGNATAIGKYINDSDPKNKAKVIGVVEETKFWGDYKPAEKAMFARFDTSAYHWLNRILIRVAPGTDAAFESRLYKVMANSMRNSNIEIEHLAVKKASYNKFMLVPLTILSIVAAFLIVNVALGLFGVLWYNINNRRGEIGLRRAVGANGALVSGQLVAEALILATFSLFVGSFFAVQFPLLNVFDLPASVYLIALILAILFIYVLVLVCSLYPGKQAAAILPAVALHEE